MAVMQHTHYGILADVLWHEIPHYHPTAELGDFVVMPNHIHGILILNNPLLSPSSTAAKKDSAMETGQDPDMETGQDSNLETRRDSDMGTRRDSDMGIRQALDMETRQALALRGETPGQQRFQHQGKNTVSSIIGSYKSAVTRHANRLGLENGWQSRFHDHIIRDDAEYQRISDYIVRNPDNWRDDTFYTSPVPQ